MKLLSIKNFYTGVLILLCLFFANISTVSAQILNVGNLDIEYEGTGALFNATNIYPGYSEIKTISVKNTGRVAHSFSIAVTGELGGLANVLQIEPRNFETGAPIWNKTISNIAKAPSSDVILGSIAPNETRKVSIVAILPESVGNEYQDSTTFAFDFVVGNESTDQKEPSESSGSASVITTSIDIKNVFTLGPAPISSNEVVKTDTPEVATSSQTDIVELASANNEGKTEGATIDNKPVCFWWWVLLALLAVVLIIYGVIVRNCKNWFFLFWPVFFGATTYVVHWIFHDYYNPSKWCNWWFIVILLAELVIYYIVRSRREED
jgi:heme/copper-type cytochrome/quinol oxidase subunit 4